MSFYCAAWCVRHLLCFNPLGFLGINSCSIDCPTTKHNSYFYSQTDLNTPKDYNRYPSSSLSPFPPGESSKKLLPKFSITIDLKQMHWRINNASCTVLYSNRLRLTLYKLANLFYYSG